MFCRYLVSQILYSIQVFSKDFLNFFWSFNVLGFRKKMDFRWICDVGRPPWWARIVHVCSWEKFGNYLLISITNQAQFSNTVHSIFCSKHSEVFPRCKQAFERYLLNHKVFSERWERCPLEIWLFLSLYPRWVIFL